MVIVILPIVLMVIAAIQAVLVTVSDVMLQALLGHAQM